MAAITCRVETPMLGWAWLQVVTVERTDFTDRLIEQGRLTLLADPESAALDQGDEPEGADQLVDALLGVAGEEPTVQNYTVEEDAAEDAVVEVDEEAAAEAALLARRRR